MIRFHGRYLEKVRVKQYDFRMEPFLLPTFASILNKVFIYGALSLGLPTPLDAFLTDSQYFVSCMRLDLLERGLFNWMIEDCYLPVSF